MKKTFIKLAAFLLLPIFLSMATSCNKPEITPTITKQQENKNTVPSSSLQSAENSFIESTGMNLTQIQAGNYSSLLGTWTGAVYAGNSHDGTGEQWKAGSFSTLSVSSDKIVYSNGDLVIQGNTLRDSAGSHTLKFVNNEGSLDASLTDQNVAINWSVDFYPKGVINDIQPNNGVKIDNTKNLIVIWTSNNGLQKFLHKPSNSVASS